MKTHLTALLTGIIFGVGLSLSHMINPNKVLDFLDISGHFDPSLLFVMLGALPIALLWFRQILKRPTPILADEFLLPAQTVINKPLVIGSIIFGIGWGMTGYCPGPAVTALGIFSFESVVMLVGIYFGVFVYKWVFGNG